MMANCKECGAEVFIGDWPWCPHGSVRGGNARRFDDIVVWQSNSDPDKYSFPGQANEPVPDGFHKVVISNLREGDQFTARFNELERARLERERDMRRTLDDAGIRDRRAEEDARGWVMKADGTKFYVRGNSRAEALRRAVREWTDRRREERRARAGSIDPRFHSQVLSFDSGSRNSYSGQETGWRERKK
jgi:hypothetical protein